MVCVAWQSRAKTGDNSGARVPSQPGGKIDAMEQMPLQSRALRYGSESKPVEAQACERSHGAWRTLVEDDLLSRI